MPVRLVFLIAVWVTAIVTGFFFLQMYKSTPGVAAIGMAQWPSESKLPHGDGFQLVMFAHPQCPCTEASLSELGKVHARAPRLKSYVVFMGSDKKDISWVTDSRLYHKAKSIQGSQVLLDRNGKEAKLFGAQTSGQTMLFDDKGKLIFAGGLTAMRGHEGDNIGVQSVIDLVNGKRKTSDTTAVFGCEIH